MALKEFLKDSWSEKTLEIVKECIPLFILNFTQNIIRVDSSEFRYESSCIVITSVFFNGTERFHTYSRLQVEDILAFAK
jgi:hypothetical protein